jgi:hypothetical protein
VVDGMDDLVGCDLVPASRSLKLHTVNRNTKLEAGSSTSDARPYRADMGPDAFATTWTSTCHNLARIVPKRRENGWVVAQPYLSCGGRRIAGLL